jgi:hydroxyacylglutathione hydrolase
MILKSLVVGPIAANCYVIGDETTREGAIIDPGDEADNILRVVEQSGLQIMFLIGTHGHFDHTAAASAIKKSLGCDFLLHKKDIPFVQHSKMSAQQWGFNIEQVPEPDRTIEEGDILELGNLELRIIHTPGHSPGGISIYVAREKLVFTGDTLFQGSIGRTDFLMGSMDELIRSIKTKLYTLPDETVAYTGHGDPTTIGHEKQYNMFVQG